MTNVNQRLSQNTQITLFRTIRTRQVWEPVGNTQNEGNCVDLRGNAGVDVDRPRHDSTGALPRLTWPCGTLAAQPRSSCSWRGVCVVDNTVVIVRISGAYTIIHGENGRY